MIDEKDIYRTAKILIREHGDKAAIHAAIRADELLEAGLKRLWLEDGEHKKEPALSRLSRIVPRVKSRRSLHHNLTSILEILTDPKR